jgi:hypothetical protein
LVGVGGRARSGCASRKEGCDEGAHWVNETHGISSRSKGVYSPRHGPDWHVSEEDDGRQTREG